MVCCFSHSVLTRAERDAIARLREQRAQGRVPGATTHRAVVEHLDPVVSFYSSPARAQAHVGARGQGRGRGHAPRPRLALPAPPALVQGAHGGGHGGGKYAQHSPGRQDNRNLHTHPRAPQHGGKAMSSSRHVVPSGLSTSSAPGPHRPPAASAVTFEKGENMSATRLTAHQRKVAIRRAARTAAAAHNAEGSAAAKASLLTVARDVLAPRRHGADMGMDHDENAGLGGSGGIDGGPSSSAARGERLRDGATALVGALKALSVWNPPSSSPSKRVAVPSSEGASSEEDATISDCDKNPDKIVPRPVGRIAWASRKRLDNVINRFAGGNPAKGERFVIKPRPELSDLAAESSNDAYFQELMKGD